MRGCSFEFVVEVVLQSNDSHLPDLAEEDAFLLDGIFTAGTNSAASGSNGAPLVVVLVRDSDPVRESRLRILLLLVAIGA